MGRSDRKDKRRSSREDKYRDRGKGKHSISSKDGSSHRSRERYDDTTNNSNNNKQRTSEDDDGEEDRHHRHHKRSRRDHSPLATSHSDDSNSVGSYSSSSSSIINSSSSSREVRHSKKDKKKDKSKKHSSSKRKSEKKSKKKRRKHGEHKKHKTSKHGTTTASSTSNKDRGRDVAAELEEKARNYRLAEALHELLTEHSTVDMSVNTLPLLLIKLAGGTSLDLRHMPNRSAAEGLNNILKTLESFGMEQEDTQVWKWNVPGGGGGAKDERILLRIVRTLLNDIGFTMDAVTQYQKQQ